MAWWSGIQSLTLGTTVQSLLVPNSFWSFGSQCIPHWMLCRMKIVSKQLNLGQYVVQCHGPNLLGKEKRKGAEPSWTGSLISRSNLRPAWFRPHPTQKPTRPWSSWQFDWSNRHVFESLIITTQPNKLQSLILPN